MNITATQDHSNRLYTRGDRRRDCRSNRPDDRSPVCTRGDCCGDRRRVGLYTMQVIHSTISYWPTRWVAL